MKVETMEFPDSNVPQSMGVGLSEQNHGSLKDIFTMDIWKHEI